MTDTHAATWRTTMEQQAYHYDKLPRPGRCDECDQPATCYVVRPGGKCEHGPLVQVSQSCETHQEHRAYVMRHYVGSEVEPRLGVIVPIDTARLEADTDEDEWRGTIRAWRPKPARPSHLRRRQPRGRAPHLGTGQMLLW